MLAQPLPIAQIWNWIRVLVSNFFSLNHITKCFCLRQIKLHVGSEYQEVQTMKLHFQLYGQGRVRRNGVSDPSIGEADSFWLSCFCPRSSLCPRFPSLHPLPSWCWFVAPGICWNTWYKRYCCLSGTLLLVEVTSCERTNWVVLSRAAEGSCFLDVLSFEHFLGFVCGGFCLFFVVSLVVVFKSNISRFWFAYRGHWPALFLLWCSGFAGVFAGCVSPLMERCAGWYLFFFVHAPAGWATEH